MDDRDDKELKRPRLVFTAMFVGISLLIWWAAEAEIDEVSRAMGYVIASSRTQVVQAPDGGVVEALLVKEGAEVKAGQALAYLDRTRVGAAVKEAESKVLALRVRRERLRAEVLERPLRFDDSYRGYESFVSDQTELYRRRQRALNEEIHAIEDSLRLVRQELDMSLPLVDTGDISKTDILKLQRQQAEIVGQITNRRNKHFQDAQQELAKVEEELFSQEQVLTERKKLLENAELRAPAAGIVKSVRVTTIGGVLRAGEEILQIVPTDGDLVVEAKLKPVDIAFVQEGMPATVKLDAYDYSVYGSLKGIVSYISADTLTEDTKAGEQVYYRVQIRITEKAFLGKKAEAIQVLPGMTGSVEIRTGSHTILRYWTKPVSKVFGSAFKER